MPKRGIIAPALVHIATGGTRKAPADTLPRDTLAYLRVNDARNRSCGIRREFYESGFSKRELDKAAISVARSMPAYFLPSLLTAFRPVVLVLPVGEGGVGGEHKRRR